MKSGWRVDSLTFVTNMSKQAYHLGHPAVLTPLLPSCLSDRSQTFGGTGGKPSDWLADPTRPVYAKNLSNLSLADAQVRRTRDLL